MVLILILDCREVSPCLITDIIAVVELFGYELCVTIKWDFSNSMTVTEKKPRQLIREAQ